MIFKETWQQVLDGTKTQTRRPVKPGDRGLCLTAYRPDEITWVGSANSRTRWAALADYAVQPGRGKPAIWLPPEGAPIDDPLAEYIRKTESARATWGPKVKEWLRARGYQEARIRITKIRREKLGEIGLRDLQAEMAQPGGGYGLVFFFVELWDSLYRHPYRWECDPEVWVLEFELVEEERSKDWPASE